MKNILISALQWLALVATGIGCWWLYHNVNAPVAAPMSGDLVILIALACAFVWAEVLKWGTVKPFNCVKCLTGWFALILALIFHVPHFYFYLPLGLFVGAIFSAIQMRYL